VTEIIERLRVRTPASSAFILLMNEAADALEELADLKATSQSSQSNMHATDTQEFTLRAMAQNYADGHSWDRLDGAACLAAAKEICWLRSELAATHRNETTADTGNQHLPTQTHVEGSNFRKEYAQLGRTLHLLSVNAAEDDLRPALRLLSERVVRTLAGKDPSPLSSVESAPEGYATLRGDDDPIAWYMHLWNEADVELKSDVRWGHPSIDDIQRAEHNGHDIEHLYARPSRRPHSHGLDPATVDTCVRLIEDNIIKDTSEGEVLALRQDGNRDGLHYAVAIRALATEGEGI
jgi:hypothetical protein